MAAMITDFFLLISERSLQEQRPPLGHSKSIVSHSIRRWWDMRAGGTESCG